MLDYDLRERAIELYNEGQHKRIKLLSRSNPKLDASVQYGYLTAGLSLIPHNIVSKKSICPFAKKCADSCLVYSGQGAKHLVRKKGDNKGFNSTLLSRAVKTIFWERNKKEFLNTLDDELGAFKLKAKRNGLKSCTRLNVYSDILWERTGIIEAHSDIIHYNYTKIPSNVPKNKNNHVTFSRDETNEHLIDEKISQGINVSVVFEKFLPREYKGHKVIDGVIHDLRFLDEKGVIVGLKAKGTKKKIKQGIDSGFFVKQIA